MSGVDGLVPLIDNGGTRSGSERRFAISSIRQPERRSQKDRRSGTDRRRNLNKKLKVGEERRITLVE
jgi:hypothetical protein